MPKTNYLLVETLTEQPMIYLAQPDEGSDAYLKVQQDAQDYCYRHSDRMISIFRMAVNSRMSQLGQTPKNSVALIKEGFVLPLRLVEHHVNLAASESDRLPDEQALQELTRSIDYLQKRLNQREARIKNPTGVENATS